MRRLVSLQMISLLIFNDHLPSTAAGRPPRCVSVEQMKKKLDRFQRTYWDKLGFLKIQKNELNNRSLSPWRYTIKTDVNRVPKEIPFAECLHHGCFIDQRPDMRYNSVPVLASLMIMKKTRCPQDTNKYVVTKDVIRVPVACTCAVPKYAK